MEEKNPRFPFNGQSFFQLFLSTKLMYNSAAVEAEMECEAIPAMPGQIIEETGQGLGFEFVATGPSPKLQPLSGVTEHTELDPPWSHQNHNFSTFRTKKSAHLPESELHAATAL